MNNIYYSLIANEPWLDQVEVKERNKGNKRKKKKRERDEQYHHLFSLLLKRDTKSRLGHGPTNCVRLGWVTTEPTVVGLGWPSPPKFFFVVVLLFALLKSCKHTCLEDFK